MQQYEETPETMFLAATMLGESEEQTDKRFRARSECASSRAKFGWMRFDVCVSRAGGKLPTELTKVRDSKDADAMFRAFLGTAHLQLQEVAAVLALDSKNSPLGFAVVGLGGTSAAPIDGQNVFKAALLLPASAVILTHNHPSGDLTPSAADLQLTKKIVEMGDVVGIRVLDHLIQTETGFFSFLDAGMLR